MPQNKRSIVLRTPFCSFPLSLSLTQTQTHSHSLTHSLTHTLTHTHTHIHTTNRSRQKPVHISQCRGLTMNCIWQDKDIILCLFCLRIASSWDLAIVYRRFHFHIPEMERGRMIHWRLNLKYILTKIRFFENVFKTYS